MTNMKSVLASVNVDHEADCLSTQCFGKDLHSSSQAKDQMKGEVFLDAVVG